MLATVLLSLNWCPPSAPGQDKSTANKWSVLFDGKSTAAFRGYKRDAFPDKGWKVEDGPLKAIVGGDEVDIITRERYQNFELELEWKISPAGNSGIMYRVSESGDAPWHTGPELQVVDDMTHGDGRNPKTAAGLLYALIAPNADKKLKPVGEYNQTTLRIRDGHVEHWLNGGKILEYRWNSPEVQALIAKSKFKDKPRFMRESEGHIALQHHGQEVWFRNIRIRKLQ